MTPDRLSRDLVREAPLLRFDETVGTAVQKVLESGGANRRTRGSADHELALPEDADQVFLGVDDGERGQARCPYWLVVHNGVGSDPEPSEIGCGPQ